MHNEQSRCREDAAKWYEYFADGAPIDMSPDAKRDYDRAMAVMIKRYFQLLGAMPDAKVLALLTDRAAELGHIPAQREVFPVYRVFIRARFKNWPNALRAAGLKPPKEKRMVKKGDQNE